MDIQGLEEAGAGQHLQKGAEIQCGQINRFGTEFSDPFLLNRIPWIILLDLGPDSHSDSDDMELHSEFELGVEKIIADRPARERLYPGCQEFASCSRL